MNYYEILGVSNDASPQEIKKAFRQIARECHPDVTNNDEAAAERFKTARKAYETLIDPVTRTRYDRRGQRRAGANGSFFDAFYRATGQNSSSEGRKGPTYGNHDAGGGPGAGRRTGKDPGNDLDLDDLFAGFGDFGFGTSEKRSTHAESRRSAASPTPGGDVEVTVDVPARVARDGGTVTAVYFRQRRNDQWRPGDADPGVALVQDVVDVRVLPGTADGEVLRERGLGHAGAHGGPYGDLLVRVRVLAERAEAPQDPPPKSETAADVVQDLDISVVEALLGGRVEVETPGGRVRLTIPPGTSSGRKFRLKERAEGGADLYLVTRIVVPVDLDAPSRALIEEFARLNPGSPRD